MAKDVGMFAKTVHLPESIQETELTTLIHEFNAADDIDGILVQLPLPAHINATSCLLAISPTKDVDGFHPTNAGCLTLGLPGLRPCTPKGILALLRHYHLSPAGKHAVVVGRSNIVGKPLALMLAEPLEYANATVTICHSQTTNLAAICKSADFLFCSVGKPHFFDRNYVKEGAVVVDVGITRTENGIEGDANFADLADHVLAISPVPGGVGPMTIAMLLQNTVQAWESRRK